MNGVIPAGGHWVPISTEGANLAWKNAQKKDRKKKTSDTINKIIPHRKLVITLLLCKPCKVPSRAISRHHWYDETKMINKPKIKILIEL